ncbi:MAG TPA: nicotinamide riboside transporter PnuC [Pyrinomonadaceae bacterium]|nr:nicotinamide riboside transporter PnuC [Pyrinomonadaceae bacterium]
MPDLSALFDVKETFFTILGSPVSYVEFIGTVLGLISVFLAARANIFTWPTGIANAIFFLVIFYQIHLYSDMFLQMYFCGMGVYGWFSWKRRAEQDHSAIRTLSNRDRLLLAALIAAVVLVVGTLISRIHLMLPQVFDHPATFPYIDTFIAISSILATILLARRIFETWVLWIAVDITSIGLYSVKGVKLIAIEFVIFLALAMLGIYSWYRLRSKSEVEAEAG